MEIEDIELTSEDDDGLYVISDVDLSDETELRRIVNAVEESCGVGHQLRVSVLTTDQWETALTRILPARNRKAIAPNTHILRDPSRPGHHLVGPSTLAGINEGSAFVTGEVVYHLVHFTGERLPLVFARGSADLLASAVARRIAREFFRSHAPVEARIVADLIEVMREEFGYDQSEWLVQMKTRPGKFLLALRKTRFFGACTTAASADAALATALAGYPRKREGMIALLCQPRAGVDSAVVIHIRDCLSRYRQMTPSENVRV